jgi:hypothetical protein
VAIRDHGQVQRAQFGIRDLAWILRATAWLGWLMPSA